MAPLVTTGPCVTTGPPCLLCLEDGATSHAAHFGCEFACASSRPASRSLWSGQCQECQFHPSCFRQYQDRWVYCPLCRTTPPFVVHEVRPEDPLVRTAYRVWQGFFTLVLAAWLHSSIILSEWPQAVAISHVIFTALDLLSLNRCARQRPVHQGWLVASWVLRLPSICFTTATVCRGLHEPWTLLAASLVVTVETFLLSTLCVCGCLLVCCHP